MLKECKMHGHFRGEDCGICGEEGKFLMNTRELEEIGRLMAGILRHFPERFGLQMDDQGWVDIRRFSDAMKARRRKYHWLRTHHIRAIIDTDPKGRYQYNESSLRATYGHSIDLDMDLPTNNIPIELYYPVTPEEIDIILETGLKPSDRKMVHLSKSAQNAWEAGSHRVDDPLILIVDAEGAIESGTVIKRAGKTVYVTLEVPPQFIRVMEEEIQPDYPDEEYAEDGEEYPKGEGAQEDPAPMEVPEEGKAVTEKPPEEEKTVAVKPPKEPEAVKPPAEEKAVTEKPPKEPEAVESPVEEKTVAEKPPEEKKPAAEKAPDEKKTVSEKTVAEEKPKPEEAPKAPAEEKPVE